MGEGQVTVLLVEDDDSLRLLCRVNLELAGFRVREAPTLAEARAALLEGPDVVLLDLHISGENAHPILEEAKLVDPAPAVLLFSGTAEIDSALRSRADGAVPKPFEIDALIGAVRDAARRPA
jgi:DNA-binding NtrC family response regulator